MDKAALVEMANANEKIMDGTTLPVIEILASSDLVWAVWQDHDADDGVSTLLLKGHRRLLSIASDTDDPPNGTTRLRRGPLPLRCSAVKVIDQAMAIAARQTLGEAQSDD